MFGAPPSPAPESASPAPKPGGGGFGLWGASEFGASESETKQQMKDLLDDAREYRKQVDDREDDI